MIRLTEFSLRHMSVIILLAIVSGCAPSIKRIGYAEATAPADTTPIWMSMMVWCRRT